MKVSPDLLTLASYQGRQRSSVGDWHNRLVVEFAANDLGPCSIVLCGLNLLV